MSSHVMGCVQLLTRPGTIAFVNEPFFVAAHVQVAQDFGLPTSVLEFAVRPLTPTLDIQHISVVVDDRVSYRKRAA